MMCYQVVKNLKTTAKILCVYDTIEDARGYLYRIGARFESLSYIGGFPVFTDKNGKTLSIQGLSNGRVVSLPQREKESFVS